uniref:Uncharacterized protein n=1 Tax=viral metagenome TaxID=1070528 RepID=A0A6C0ECF5_9ZZZZ
MSFDISTIETSSVPPPKSYTITLIDLSSFPSILLLIDLSIIPYANDAAVGSFINLTHSIPAISAASFVACFCESVNDAGTVITAFLTSFCKYLVAIDFNFDRTFADISSGENVLLSFKSDNNLILSFSSPINLYDKNSL